MASDFKRTFIVLLIILWVVVFLNGVAVGAAPVTIKFLHVWGGARIPLMEEQIADFQRLHPDIKVQAQIIPQEGMNEKYLTSIAGGDPPDVIMLQRNQLPFFASQNALMPLDNFIIRDKMNLREIFYDAEVELCTWMGKVYALPNATAAGWNLLYYNKDMFKAAGLDPKKAPQTWQDMEQAQAKLSKIVGSTIYQLGVVVRSPDPTLDAFINVWLATNNGMVLSSDRKKVMINNKEGVETLRWLADFVKRSGGYQNILTFLQTLRGPGGPIPVGFYNSKIAMMVDGVWMFFQIPNEAPKGFNFGVALIPYNGNNPEARSVELVDGGWSFAIPRGAKHPEAAWEWLKYSCAGEGNKKFFQAQLRPTPIRKFNEDPFYHKSNPYWDVVLKNLATAKFSPPLPVTPQIKQLIRDQVDLVLYGQKSVEEGLNQAAREAQKIVDEWWVKGAK